MKYWGIAVLFIGLGVALFALSMTTTAAQVGSYDNVYNLGLLQIQSLTFISGCALTISGVVLLTVGLLVDRIALIAREVPSPGNRPATPTAPKLDLPAREVALSVSSGEFDRRRATHDRIIYWSAGTMTLILVAVVIMSLR